MVELEEATLPVLQAQFELLDLSVKQAQPKVDAMKAAYEEAAMLLADMKYKRGKAAYWLTVRKGQR